MTAVVNEMLLCSEWIYANVSINNGKMLRWIETRKKERK